MLNLNLNPNDGVPPSQVEVRGNYAFVVDSIGMRCVDISNPMSPILRGTFNDDSYIFYGIDVSGNYAFLTSANYDNLPGGGGLWVIDISDPTDISYVANKQPFWHKNIIGGTEIDGNIAYTFGFDTVRVEDDLRKWGFLDAFDISTLSSPAFISSDTMLWSVDDDNNPIPIDLQDWANFESYGFGELDIEGDTCYVSWRTYPYPPHLANDYVSGVWGHDNHIGFFDIIQPVYSGPGTGVLAFVPWQTDELGYELMHNLGYAKDVDDVGGAIDVEGNFIYSTNSAPHPEGPPITTPEFGVFSYDLLNTTGPILRREIYNWSSIECEYIRVIGYLEEIQPQPLELLIDGDYGFLSAGDFEYSYTEGLYLIYVANPSLIPLLKIPLITHWLHYQKFNGFDIAGDFLFAVGSQVSPAIAHKFYTIKVYERNHYTGEGLNKQLLGFSFEHPKIFTVSAYPNPFNIETKISINMPPEIESVDISIFDMVGKQITQDQLELPENGQTDFTWNAKNNSTGIYFAVISVGTSKEIIKLLLMK